jgi:hypothetical protein
LAAAAPRRILSAITIRWGAGLLGSRSKIASSPEGGNVLTLVSLRRPARRLGRVSLALLVTATVGVPVARATPASAIPEGHGLIRISRSDARVSLTRSRTAPHWACPHSVCEAIVDPPPVRQSAGYALPGGPLLEGGGEFGGYDPADLQSAYKIPALGGSTQTVAVVDAFGYAAAEADLAKYRERYGLQACTKASGCFEKLNQTGEEGNYPEEGKNTEQTGWEFESALDLDMVSAACPSCHIMLVEASNGRSAVDLATGVDTAVAHGATEVSNSYGIPEEYCASIAPECETAASAYVHPGVVITASSGDNGYDNTFYPSIPFHSASLPAAGTAVIAVGGTALHKAINARGWSESVWGEPEKHLGTGSGCSTSQSKPAWQTDPACSMKMTSDVSAVAACATPVSVYDSVEGGWENACGTSASSPLVAAIMAHASEEVRSLGARAFYEEPTSLFDVTEGNNGTCTPPAEDAYFCSAAVGYDGPTGLGTPDEVPLGAGPVVTGVEPHEGAHAGGTVVRITGFKLGGATAVKFGSADAAGFTVESETAISAVSPAGSGTVDVTVTTPEGTSGADPGDRFTYQPPGPPPAVTKVSPNKGPASGATTVTITGSHLSGATAVSFGPTEASYTVNSSTSITATSPAGTATTVDVIVTTPDGTSALTKKDRFKYGKPTVTGVSPSSGSKAGGATVTISGSGFAPGNSTAFLFGKTAATSVSCASTSQCTATTPAVSKVGAVDVRALVGKAKSSKSPPADQYAFE